MIRTFTLLSVSIALAVPQAAFAYLNPEDVLLSREQFFPPTPREAAHRTELQYEESNARREREQERAFSLQHPVVEEPVFASAPEEPAAPFGFPQGGYYVYPAAPASGAPAAFGQPAFGTTGTQTANLELQRTMRLLSRVNQNQALAQFQSVLHSGAPDLAPTGAGSIFAASIMIGAVGWTIRRADASKKNTRVIS